MRLGSECDHAEGDIKRLINRLHYTRRIAERRGGKVASEEGKDATPSPDPSELAISASFRRRPLDHWRGGRSEHHSDLHHFFTAAATCGFGARGALSRLTQSRPISPRIRTFW